MSLLYALVGAAVGGGLGFGGAWLAPRWMDSTPRREAIWAVIGAAAVLVGLLAYSHGLGAYFWPRAIFLGILVVASFIDLFDRIIPNELMLFGLGAGLLSALVLPSGRWGFFDALLGGVAGLGFLLFLAVLVRGGMGIGDVKLAGVMGLFLGWPWIFMGLVLGFLSGGLVAGALMAFTSVTRKDKIPFGPFLALGAALTALYGEAIWAWYIGI